MEHHSQNTRKRKISDNIESVESSESSETLIQPSQTFGFSACDNIGDKKFEVNVLKPNNCEEVDEQDIKPYKCQHCKKSFRTNEKLKYHTNTHTGNKPYLCKQCPAAFAAPASLEYHTMGIHSERRSFECNICEAKFKLPQHLRVHNKTHTGIKPFKCSICNATFAAKYTLILHERTHTKEKPFECTLCKFRFTQPSSLKTHLRIHTGEKPFECTECNAKFADSSARTYHIRTVHLFLKPFACDQCESKFSKKDHLIVHKRAIHSKTGQKRRKIKEQRFFRELQKEHNIQFNIETEREVMIDFKCVGQGGNLARLDGFVILFFFTTIEPKYVKKTCMKLWQILMKINTNTMQYHVNPNEQKGLHNPG